MEKYDIFISYRREGGFETADAIYQRLKNAGYRVFFDLEKLRSGKFNTQLLDIIAQCKDFIVVLPQNGLERVDNPDDWVRIELSQALKLKKNIIPVMLRGFTWPEKLPDEIAEVKFYQGVTASDYNYFDASIEKLKNYLQSKRGITWQRYKKLLIGAIAATLLLAAVGYGYYQKENRYFENLCNQQVNLMGQGVNAINMNLNLVKSAYEEWKSYARRISAAPAQDTARIRQEFIRLMEHKKKSVVPVNPEYILPERTAEALARNGIKTEEIKIFYSSVLPMDISETDAYLNSLISYARLPAVFDWTNRFAELICRGREYSAKATYYYFLSFLTGMPQEVYTDFNKIRPLLDNFSEIPVTLDAREYESQGESMMQKYQNIVMELGAINHKEEVGMAEMEHNVSQLKQEVNRKQTEGTLKKLSAKREEVENKRAEVSEAEKTLAEAYERALKKFEIDPQDDQGYMWGKVLRMLTLAHNAQVYRTEAEKQYQEQKKTALAQNIDPSFLTKPLYTYTLDHMFDQVDKWLSTYLEYQKTNESQTGQYIEAARKYYRQIQKGRVPYAGIIATGTQHNAPHPLFKTGDIVIKFKGKEVKSVEQYIELKKVSGTNPVSFYRTGDAGQLVLMTDELPQTDVLVAFANLTESE